MRCPKCHFEDTKVLESRLSLEGQSIRRRRSCLKCNYRFTTYEKEEELNLLVKKKDGRFEAFSMEKAMRAVQVACQKRPIDISKIEEIAIHLTRKLQDEGERVVESRRIGELIMDALKDLDQVAYVRFASVYKEFKDTEEFLLELKSLENESASNKI